jgi:transcriptional regulator with XRE-family HTH domain
MTDSACRRCRSAVLKGQHEATQLVFPPHQQSLAAVAKVGQQIRALREGRAITRKDFSLLLFPHVSRSYIYRIESGSVKPSIETLERIAAVLDLPLGAFFLDSDSLETLVYSRFVHQIVSLLKSVPDGSFEAIVSFARRITSKNERHRANRRGR